MDQRWQVRVQQQDFDVGAELAALQSATTGAIASFLGVARDLSDAFAVQDITLEHYPGMTEHSLAAIVERARARFALVDARVIHRVGRLRPADRIVLVAAASTHRDQAFDACRFIVDYLKTEAPFWKRENGPSGARWVEARASDDTALRRWE